MAIQLITEGLSGEDAANLIYQNDKELEANIALKIGVTRSANLYNYLTAIPDKFIDWTSGILQTNTSYSASDWIPIDPSSPYFLSGIGAVSHYAFYNSAKVFISGAQNPVYPITSPANAGFIRVSFGKSAITTAMLAKSPTALAFVPYQALDANANALLNATYRQLLVKINEADLTIITKSANLFDYTKVTPEFFVNWTNGTLTPNVIYAASDWIPIDPSSDYFLSGVGATSHYAFYTSAKVYISGQNSPVYPITSPANAGFIRVSVAIGLTEQATFAKSSTAVGWTKPYILNENIQTESSPSGTIPVYNWYSFGDSLAQQAQYLTTVLDECKGFVSLTHFNRGVGGSRYSGGAVDALNNDARIATIGATADLITIIAGTNDFAQNVPLGAFNSVDINQFCGAVNVVITKLLTGYPLRKIYIVTPPYQERVDYVPSGWPDPSRNTLGLTVYDYSIALAEVAERRGIPTIEIYKTVGWNSLNVNSFMASPTDHFHPNALGGGRIGVEIAKWLRFA